MQGCAMRLGDGRVSGICLCGFHGYAPTRGFVVFTPYAITEMSSLCSVEVLGSMDHGGSWECSRVLEIGFVSSSICFLRVRLVSGVFG